MAKKKNKIFQQEEAPASPAVEEENACDDMVSSGTPEVSNESMVEDVPDDPTERDLLDDKLSQISQLTAELNAAKQKIAELESTIEKLQADNDQLVMKLADVTAKNVEMIQIPLKVQLPSGAAVDVVGKTNGKAVSKRVNYIHTDYSNNGYGTWR